MNDDTNLLAPELVEDPYPFFHRLRREDPVHWNTRHRAWLVTRYDDVERGARDPRLSADRVSTFVAAKRSEDTRELYDPIERLLGNWMVFQDPPTHGRLRKLVHQAFTLRGLEALEPMIDSVVHEEIARFRAAGGGNFIEEVAAPIPAIVIARLLGVPEKDHDRFRHWSDEVMTLVFANVDDPRRHERAHVGLLALERYFRALLDDRLATPRTDLLTALARAEEAGDRLSSDEVIATCILLLFAGHETTTSLLGTGLLALLRNPDEWRALRDDPALAASAVEEFLRYDGPQKVMMRFVADDLELRGKRLRRGERVLLIGAAANRDPEVFPDPDRLDLDRSPNEHLGFGYGIHYCLGAPLARMEGRLAFAAIARELPDVRLAGPAPEWHRTIVSRGLRSFPVAL